MQRRTLAMDGLNAVLNKATRPTPAFLALLIKATFNQREYGTITRKLISESNYNWCQRFFSLISIYSRGVDRPIDASACLSARYFFKLNVCPVGAQKLIIGDWV